jgi:hypothetical protein
MIRLSLNKYARLLANPFLNYNLIADCSNGKEPKNDAKESEAQDAKQIDMA